MPVSKIKVFGERNSGTNFTELFVTLNFPEVDVLRHPTMPEPEIAKAFPQPFAKIVEERLIDDVRAREFKQNFGWKHARTDASDLMTAPQFQETGFIFVARNPFTWLKSMLRRPYSLYSAATVGKDADARDMDTFLGAPILTVLRDNLDQATVNSPMQLWSYKVRSYVDCAAELGTRGLLLRYEDMVKDPRPAADAIAAFGLHRPETLKISATSTKGDAMTFSDYQDQLRTYTPRQDFSVDQIQRIQAGLDHALCSELGYQLDWG